MTKNKRNNGWIAVSERLPEPLQDLNNDNRILLWASEDEQYWQAYFGWYHNNGCEDVWMFDNYPINARVTHWQPLPEAPKGQTMPTPYWRESALRLVRQSPQTKRQLATELGISEASVRKLMYGLEKDGLITSGLECHPAHCHPTKRVRTYRIKDGVSVSLDAEMQRRREAVAEFGALPIVF